MFFFNHYIYKYSEIYYMYIAEISSKKQLESRKNLKKFKFCL